jgi:hypothetical protein
MIQSIVFLAALGAGPFDTRDCRQDPARYQCHVVATSPSGNHAVVMESGTESDLLLVSRKSGREYEDFGSSDRCQIVSEGGVICDVVGTLQSVRFRDVNGSELVDLRYDREHVRRNLCGRKLPLSYNEGSRSPLRVEREFPNVSRNPGEYFFVRNDDEEMEEDDPLERVRVKVDGDHLYLGYLDWDDVDDGVTYVPLQKRIHAPGVRKVRFVRGLDALGGAVSSGGDPDDFGPRYLVVIETDRGQLLWGQDHRNEFQQFQEWVALPNGTVDPLDHENKFGDRGPRQRSFLCDESL